MPTRTPLHMIKRLALALLLRMSNHVVLCIHWNGIVVLTYQIRARDLGPWFHCNEGVGPELGNLSCGDVRREVGVEGVGGVFRASGGALG